MMTYEFVSFEPNSERGVDGTMTIRALWRPFPWLLRKKRTKEIQFHGGGTVWHRVPSFRRAGTLTEHMLSEFKARWDHEQQQQRSDTSAHRRGAA